MEQQVNLYQPILGAEKRIFSARAIGGGLLILGVCLGGLHAFGAWRTGRIERSVAIIERQAASQMSQRDAVGAALRPSRSIVELQAQALELSADIAARERALDLVNRDTASPATGFAARLEALGRRQIDGLWLRTIVVGSGDGRLALQGATVDRRLVPQYLASLAEERAFDGVRFNKLAMRQARREEAPAQLMFELGASGLDFPTPENRK
jgi:Tfp pilus assembly protein PilN